MIEEVKEKIAIYQNLLPLSAENQKRLDKKFRLEFNYNSNHIEGNTISYKGTELLLFYDIIPQENTTLREAEEIKGHDLVLLDMQESIERGELLTERKIKEWHQMLLVRPFYKEAITAQGEKTMRLITVGDYKKQPNGVQLPNGEIFEYATVQDTPILMGELMQWLREQEAKKEMHPIVLAAHLHYKFVRIHPFDDGNGRLSRLLMNYILLKNNLPFVIIQSEDKNNYLAALAQADLGNMLAFENYISRQMLWSLNLAIKAAKGESLEEDADLMKELTILEKRFQAKNKSKTLRSKEAILNIFDDSIVRLHNDLLDKANIFLRFYQRGDNNLEAVKKAVHQHDWNSKENIVDLGCDFKNLRNIGNHVNYNMGFSVRFDKDSYIISCLDSENSEKQTKLMEKSYHEQLLDAEIKTIIKHITEKHKKFLEEKLNNDPATN